MAIGASTQVYGIIGMPVAHSLSPAMHNRAFAELGLDAVYVPLPAADAPSAVAALRALGIRGASVTIPHKQAVIDYLDSIDPVAAKIGAVNTLVQTGGKIHGLNTDWIGANRALSQVIELAGRTALVLGAGGSARAIGFGLITAGARVLIASRNQEKGQLLAAQLACPWHALEKAQTIRADILVNATPVGMTPDTHGIPIALSALSGFTVVMDIVYAPLATRLLQEAQAAGCLVVDGLAMLLYQAAAQFETWTGVPAPVDAMRHELSLHIGKKK